MNPSETQTEPIAACLLRWTENPELALHAEFDSLLAMAPLFPTDRIDECGILAAGILERKPGAAIELVMQMAGSAQPQTRALAAVVVSRLALYAPALWTDLIRHIATDENWEVRRYAARALDCTAKFDGAAEFHLEFVVETVASWTTDKNYLVRYAATQSLLGYVKRHPEFAERWLGLLDPLYDDASEYVRDGAAGALRAVGKLRPDLALSFIELKLDTLKEWECQTYLTALDHPFTDKRPEWKAKLQSALAQAAEGFSR